VSSTSLTLALLRHLPPERVDGLVMQASEKPAQERKSDATSPSTDSMMFAHHVAKLSIVSKAELCVVVVSSNRLVWYKISGRPEAWPCQFTRKRANLDADPGLYSAIS